MIYFIEAVGANAVKVGYAANVGVRIKYLQTGCPFELRILKIIEGSRQDEAALHRKWWQAHLRGEWFTLSKLRAEIVAETSPIPTVIPLVSKPVGPNYSPDAAWDEHFSGIELSKS